MSLTCNCIPLLHLWLLLSVVAKESANSLENNEKSNKNLNETKKPDEKTLTDNHNTENKDSNEKNRKTTTEKKNDIENKDTKEDKSFKKKKTEKGGEQNKEIKKKDKESKKKGKEGKNKPKGNNSPREKSKIYTLGDSMIKKLNDYFLTRKVRHKYLIKVRSFSGAKVSCMVDHVKPTLRDDKPDHIILHVGTNDLRTEKTGNQITKSIMDLTTSLKTMAIR